MDISRRDFVGLTTAAMVSGVAATARGADTAPGDDPLGRRKDFPVLDRYRYLNSPYIAPSPLPVIDAVNEFNRSKTTDPITLGPMLEETRLLRQRLAGLVNAVPAEIGLLSTTSEGENVVTAALDWKAGDNVVIDDLHYDTTFLLYEHLAEAKGIDLRVVPNVAGAASSDAFAERTDDRTRLISVSWVSHQNGFRHDLENLSALAHAHGAYLYVDAIQGIGAIPLDVRQTDIDFFCAGSYKWMLGGFGVAAFYVRESLLDEISMDRVGWRQLESEPSPGDYRFHADARKYGYATPAFGAVYQLRAGLDYLMDIGIQRIEAHAVPLAGYLNRELRALGLRVRTPADNASQIVAFEHGARPEAATAALEAADVKVSLREDGTQIRAGIGLFNNRQDIDELLNVVEGLRGW